ncbi:MAG: hypothetical protein HRF45_08605 [Fimbriimonadia bacterium]
MPTYGYICTECDHEFEVFQSATAPPVSTCERCGGKVRKQIHAVGIAFKGAGFHINDYSSRPSTPPACEASSKSETPCASGGCCPLNSD